MKNRTDVQSRVEKCQMCFSILKTLINLVHWINITTKYQKSLAIDSSENPIKNQYLFLHNNKSSPHAINPHNCTILPAGTVFRSSATSGLLRQRRDREAPYLLGEEAAGGCVSPTQTADPPLQTLCVSCSPDGGGWRAQQMTRRSCGQRDGVNEASRRGLARANYIFSARASFQSSAMCLFGWLCWGWSSERSRTRKQPSQQRWTFRDLTSKKYTEVYFTEGSCLCFWNCVSGCFQKCLTDNQ